MADHLHPAIDIPGGLWRGAIVEVHSIGMTLTIVSMAGGPYIEGHRGPWDLADLSLRLDDPLGLGLAGLAARVAERCGYEWSPADGIDDLAEMLADERWAPVPWRYWYKDDLSVQVIREAGTLLAQLDRLVAATWPEEGVQCLPGTVPTWERKLLDPMGANLWAWTLTVEPVGTATWTEAAHPSLATPDPLAALGAALEVPRD